MVFVFADCPQVQVIERYEPNQPDELQLEESDVVDVFRKMADGSYNKFYTHLILQTEL